MSRGASMLMFSSFHSNALLQDVLDASGLVCQYSSLIIQEVGYVHIHR